MNCDDAKANLANRLTRKILERFEDATGEPITSQQLADDLIEWYNSSDLRLADITRLAKLAQDGRFRSWECPTCGDGTRVYEGDPENWGHFQGVLQADYSSYPGYGIGSDDRRCDSCRMWMKGYLPDGYHLEAD